MKITLKELRLTNFKGIKSKSIEFGDNTDILGKNGTGKSTVFDAFLWLLFGKDSDGKSDFSIKTLDSNSNPISKLEHEVEGILDIDGAITTLKRTYREKWVKKRGESEPEFSGHETAFFWNEVPVNQKEYKEKIDALCDENLFKLLTNPESFNNLNWQDRRNILFDICGDVSNDEVLDSISTVNNKDQILFITNLLNSGKSLDEQKRESASKKKKLKNELDLIPTRIDEINRNIPEMPDVKSINASIEKHEKEVSSLDDQISDIAKANESMNQVRIQNQNKVHEIQSKLQDIEFKLKSEHQSKRESKLVEIRNVEYELSNIKSNIEKLTRNLEYAKNDKSQLESDVAALRKSWVEINEEQIEFNDHEFKCPTCNRELDPNVIFEKKEEMTSNFNKDKDYNKKSLKEKAEDKKEQIGIKYQLILELEQSITKNQEEQKSLESKLEKLKSNLSEEKEFDLKEAIIQNDEYQELSGEMHDLQTELNLPEQSQGDTTALREKRANLINLIQDLKSKLALKDQIERSNARIKELEDQTRKLSQEIADLERNEFAIEQFTKAKTQMTEERINSMFELVSFKMYNQLINGGEEPTCVTLINGVPFPDANNAARINAGLDIIKTLSDYYDIYAPIFIDNAEAVNKLIDSDSQIIRLVVTFDEELKIESKELELAQNA